MKTKMTYMSEKFCVSLVDWSDSNALYGALDQPDAAGLVYDQLDASGLVTMMALRLAMP